MSAFFKISLQYLFYPLCMMFTVWIVMLVVSGQIPYWPSSIILILLSGLLIALVEYYLPYQPKWLDTHQDFLTDIVHAVFNLFLIVSVAKMIEWLDLFRFIPRLWPDQISVFWQIIIVALIIDFGLWFMHYMSHKYRFLWKLHAIHHHSRRLYWLNAEKRHPLSAIVLAGPSLTVLALFGAPSLLIGCWLMFMAVHLFFQHANVDYRVGPLKYIFAVAEVHRSHHQHGLGRKNFGEVFIFWDIIFGSFFYEDKKVKHDQVGVRIQIPNQYLAQLRWPFKK
ncbi:sterol desaturase family protein [Acinetobacter sp. AS167]|uniref:sterol desaturase family protein n=1 Tax=Acinetobacter sp. AS167 TaxID=3127884 RepID=UPI003017CF7D